MSHSEALLSPVENGGAFRGKIWVKMAARMCAVRRSDKMGRQPNGTYFPGGMESSGGSGPFLGGYLDRLEYAVRG
jgi:hypothetical protein